MVCIYHRLCNHHSFEESLDCFQFLVIMTKHAMNVFGYMDFCVYMVFIFSETTAHECNCLVV